MAAYPVTSDADLDSPDLVTCSLPLPFGQHLLLAPVVWSLEGKTKLTKDEWNALIGRLRKTTTERPQTAIFTQAVTHEDQPDLLDNDDEELSDYEDDRHEFDEEQDDEDDEEDDEDEDEEAEHVV